MRARAKERGGGTKRGVKLPPSSEKRPPASPPLSSPLPSQSVFTPIPRQHHRRARDLRVEHPSVFNAAPLTRALSFLPSSSSPLSLPFPFLSLSSLPSPPRPPRLTLRTGSRSLSLNRILAFACPPLATPVRLSPLPPSRSEHAREPRVRARPTPSVSGPR